ncbi:hypothetical protein PF010_g13246 [Phytophthora fragariae]|uniref:Uncharacterized protein n=1 Tax=Phytophthora fragariae TaxID=53985 RepID=A0A6A4DI62_9STRA|nr:hypothetical protein PF003_g19 [Phytophthora fragariae]KAE9104833.1 hypothetical protein PF010_g13246 [Phytophthora fragariae]KAE9230621.1 hypothetical protein PF002_g12938 [Phytophthora fragariae]KAE9306290.1 hypothetical protein PF001_g12201 [Phytophthora fragariae]
MPPSDSDAETVLGEDSPLSPCLWTQPAVVYEAETRQATAAERAPSSAEPRFASHAPSRELLLSPASQLNVLSQISELADAQSRQSAPALPLARPIQRRAHVWAPALDSATGKRSSRSTAAAAKPKAKKKQKQSTRSQAERLAADMLDWETCSEGDLFIGGEVGDWSYEDISDSDFDG